MQFTLVFEDFVPASPVTSPQCLCDPKPTLGVLTGRCGMCRRSPRLGQRGPADLAGGVFSVGLVVVVLLLKWAQQVQKQPLLPGRGQGCRLQGWRGLLGPSPAPAGAQRQ